MTTHRTRLVLSIGGERRVRVPRGQLEPSQSLAAGFGIRDVARTLSVTDQDELGHLRGQSDVLHRPPLVRVLDVPVPIRDGAQARAPPDSVVTAGAPPAPGARSPVRPALELRTTPGAGVRHQLVVAERVGDCIPAPRGATVRTRGQRSGVGPVVHPIVAPPGSSAGIWPSSVKSGPQRTPGRGSADAVRPPSLRRGALVVDAPRAGSATLGTRSDSPAHRTEVCRRVHPAAYLRLPRHEPTP